MKEKIFLVENARRGWIMNIINIYGLIFLLPYYVLDIISPFYVFLYSIIFVIAMPHIASKVSLHLTREFRKKLISNLSQRNLLIVSYLGLYGEVIPQVSQLFVPIMISLSLVINFFVMNPFLKLFLTFILFFGLVYFFTYRNIKVVKTRLNDILAYIRSQ
ncbi:MAG: hypothetical protein Q6363_000600 [Candidatus Njordarchaeota archaeon]